MQAGDPFGIEKKDNKPKQGPSGGRLVTGAIAPGWHGAIAGKKGKYRKLKAAGTEFGLATVGSALGPPGTMAGGMIGANIAHNKGWLKKQPVKKNLTGHDAFGFVEFEKAFRMPGSFSGPKMKPTQFAGAAKAKFQGGANRAMGATQGAGQKLNRAGARMSNSAMQGGVRKPGMGNTARMGAGRAGQKLGAGIAQRPGAALGVAGGVGAAGAGGALAANKNRQQRRF